MAFGRTRSRGGYSTRGRARPRRAFGRTARRSTGRARRATGGRGQVIRLVVEAAPASGVSRNPLNPVPGVPLTGPKKAKY